MMSLRNMISYDNHVMRRSSQATLLSRANSKAVPSCNQA